jgi:hypothetical protein
MVDNENDVTVSISWGASNENDVTVSIFYSARNRNNGTVTFCGNDAQLWSLVILYIRKLQRIIL